MDRFISRPASIVKDVDLQRISSLPSIPTMSTFKQRAPILAAARAAFEQLDISDFIDRTATSTPANNKHCVSSSSSGLSSPAGGCRPPPRKSLFGITPFRDTIIARPEDDVFRKDVSSSPIGGAQLVTNAQTVVPVVVDAKPPVRPDRLLEPITKDNVQGYFPITHSVFVANLSANREIHQLEQSVTAAFEVYGRCWVRVGYDKPNNYPFAVVTYEKEDAAISAMRHRHNTELDGREIRVEHAGSSTVLILTRSSGYGGIDPIEARTLLEQYGTIVEITPTTNKDRLQFGLGAGLRVKFAYYLDYKDCSRQFPKSNDKFAITRDPSVNARPRPPHNVHNHSGYHPQQAASSFVARSMTDQKSVFVGGLPETCDEKDLKAAFEHFGPILGCNIVTRSVVTACTPGVNIFGFVEFENPEVAAVAAEAEISIHGARVRVEPKMYSQRGGAQYKARLVAHTPVSGTRRRQTAWGPSNSVYHSPAPVQYAYLPYHHPAAICAHTGLIPCFASPPPTGPRGRAGSNATHNGFHQMSNFTWPDRSNLSPLGFRSNMPPRSHDHKY